MALITSDCAATGAQYEAEGHPFFASARLWDDGVRTRPATTHTPPLLAAPRHCNHSHTATSSSAPALCVMRQ